MFDPNVILDRRAVLQEIVKEDIWSVWYAAQYDKVQRMETLIDRDKEVCNAIHPETSWSPLHYAAKYANENVVELLLKHDADVQAQDNDGNTALHLSAGWGSKSCCQKLLLEGAEPTFPNAEGISPIDFAIKYDRKELAEYLRNWEFVGPTQQEKLDRLKRVERYKNKQREVDKEESEEIFLELQALRLKEATKGTEYHGSIVNIVNLANLYRAENRIEKELEMMEKALRVTIANYSDESAETAIAKCNLACRSYASDRKSSRARNLLEQSLATLTRLENLPLRMDCIESYCALMLSEQEYIAIEPYLFELLTSREEQLGTQHPNLLPMLESLGQVYLAQGDFGLARQYFERVLSTIQHLYGNESHPLAAHVYQALGSIAFKQRQFEAAVMQFRKSQDILLTFDSETSDEIVDCQRNIAFIELYQRKPQDE